MTDKLLTGCVTSGKYLSLSETHVCHLLSDYYKRMDFIGLLGLNGLDEIMYEHRLNIVCVCLFNSISVSVLVWRPNTL